MESDNYQSIADVEGMARRMSGERKGRTQAEKDAGAKYAMEASTLFGSIDDDNSGKIDIRELGEDLSILGMSEIQIKELMDELDADGNGTLTQSEFLQGYEAFSKVSNDTECVALFRAMDLNGDGIIDEYELSSHLSDLGMDGGDIERLMLELDLDGSGSFELEEWMRGYGRFLNLTSAFTTEFEPLQSPAGGFTIKDSAHRAIELGQLEQLYAFVERQLKITTWDSQKSRTTGEMQEILRYSRVAGKFVAVPLKDPKEVNLYDMVAFVLKPATYHALCPDNVRHGPAAELSDCTCHERWRELGEIKKLVEDSIGAPRSAVAAAETAVRNAASRDEDEKKDAHDTLQAVRRTLADVEANLLQVTQTLKRYECSCVLGLAAAEKTLADAAFDPDKKRRATKALYVAQEAMDQDYCSGHFRECACHCQTTINRCKRESCSMVEFMALEEQSPDFFVSHWYGESCCDTLLCLRQHAKDRKLSPLKTCYWICAYASNHWNLKSEIGKPLEDRSFLRAIRISKGTVSVVDSKGIYFTRSWCQLELYESLLNKKRNQLFDMYTAHGHTFEYKKGNRTIKEKRFAVGITDTVIGAAVDIEDKYSHGGFEAAQAARERPFPIKLLDMAVAFRCQEGKASILKDQKSILATISAGHGCRRSSVAGNQTNDAAPCAEAVETLGQKGATFVENSSVLRVPAWLLDEDDVLPASKALISAGAQMDLQHQLGGTAMLISTRPRNPQNTAHQEYLNKSVHGMIAQIALHRVLMEDVIDERRIGGKPEKDLHKQLQELQESLTKAKKLSPNADQSGIIRKINNMEARILKAQRGDDTREGRFTAAVHCNPEMSIKLPVTGNLLDLDTDANLDLLLNNPDIKYENLTLSTTRTTMPGLWQITTLTTLDLHANFKQLTPSIGKLNSLAHLTLRQCPNLEALPEKLSDLMNLTLLNIRECNALKTIPSKVTDMTSHAYIHLYRCSKLRDLPQTQNLCRLGCEACNEEKLCFKCKNGKADMSLFNIDDVVAWCQHVDIDIQQLGATSLNQLTPVELNELPEQTLTEAISGLIKRLGHNEAGVRRATSEVLSKVPEAQLISAVPLLVKKLRNTNARESTISVLDHLPLEELVKAASDILPNLLKVPFASCTRYREYNLTRGYSHLSMDSCDETGNHTSCGACKCLKDAEDHVRAAKAVFGNLPADEKIIEIALDVQALAQGDCTVQDCELAQENLERLQSRQLLIVKPMLYKCLSSFLDYVRLAAVQLLGQLALEELKTVIPGIQMRLSDTEEVYDATLNVLLRLPADELLDVPQLLDEKAARDKVCAVLMRVPTKKLAKLGEDNKSVISRILLLSNAISTELRVWALGVLVKLPLGKLPKDDLFKLKSDLLPRLKDGEAAVRKNAVEALGKIANDGPNNAQLQSNLRFRLEQMEHDPDVAVADAAKKTSHCRSS